VRIDTRWATANADDIRKHAAELAALAPDVILANLCPRGAGALLVGTGVFTNSHRERIVALAARRALPGIYIFRSLFYRNRWADELLA
jgi:hypothetical protein